VSTQLWGVRLFFRFKTAGANRLAETIWRLQTHMNKPMLNPSRDDFAAMLEASPVGRGQIEGKVITARVVGIEHDFVVVDIGLKTEGRIPLREFMLDDVQPVAGADVDIYLDRVENALGDAVVSRERARREEAWTRLEKVFEQGELVDGVLVGRVKGGFTVDLGGANAFLPGSQVDIRPVRDVQPLMNVKQPFAILKMDRQRGNIVVSRRSVMEQDRAGQRAEIVGQLIEGETREGVVKNITDYGAFVDLGGIDGLLHVTDMSWKRVSHPSQVVNVGDTVKVQIVKINPDTHRISLGMKQLMSDPWDGVDVKYPVDGKFSGIVTNITDYGAFVELEPGVEGLVHVSEMSWTKKNVHPGKIVSSSQEVDVLVLDVDADKRRISLGLKQVMANPWEKFVEDHPVGSLISGEIKNVTEFGLFVGLNSDLDGMVHLSDIAWDVQGEEALARYNKGDTVTAKVLDVDMEKERISLGMKQAEADPLEGTDLRRGQTVTVEILKIEPMGLEVAFGEGNATKSYIRKGDLSRDRNDQRTDRFAVGDRVDAMITAYDRQTRKISLSIKALQLADEKEAIAQFGSSDSGASLGDILGAALRKSATKED
jgi:small subunit ribosomal protein S1